jgi:hypothetical protein
LQDLFNTFPGTQWEDARSDLEHSLQENSVSEATLMGFASQVHSYLDKRYFNSADLKSFVNSLYFEHVIHSALACAPNADLKLLSDNPAQEKHILDSLRYVIALQKHNEKCTHEYEIIAKTQSEIFKQFEINLGCILEFKKEEFTPSFSKRFIENRLLEREEFQIAAKTITSIVNIFPHVLRYENCQSDNLLQFFKNAKHAAQAFSTDAYSGYTKLYKIYQKAPSPEIKEMARDILGGEVAIARLKALLTYEQELFSFALTHFDRHYPHQKIAAHIQIILPVETTSQAHQSISLPQIEQTLMVDGLIKFEKLIIDGEEFDANSHQSPSGKTTSTDRTYIDKLFYALIYHVGREWWVESLAEIPEMIFSHKKIGAEMLIANVDPKMLEVTAPYTKRLQKEIPPFFIFQASSMEMWTIGEQKIRAETPELFPFSTAKTFSTRIDINSRVVLDWSFNEQNQHVTVSQQRSFQFEFDKDFKKKTFGSFGLKVNYVFNKEGELLENTLTMPTLSFDADAPVEHRLTICSALLKYMQ